MKGGVKGKPEVHTNIDRLLLRNRERCQISAIEGKTTGVEYTLRPAIGVSGTRSQATARSSAVPRQGYGFALVHLAETGLGLPPNGARIQPIHASGMNTEKNRFTDFLPGYRKCGDPGRIRTCDTWIRNPVLYPLSYGAPIGSPANIGANVPAYINARTIIQPPSKLSRGMARGLAIG